MLYKQIIRLFSKESAFRLMMFKAGILSRLNIVRSIVRFNHPLKASLRREVLGISFNGPVGLGPGLDRKGELYNVFTDYGFSFVEIGPISASTVKNAITHVQNYPVDKDTSLSICINDDHETTFSLAYDFMDMFVFDIMDGEIVETISRILDIRLSYDVYKPVLLRLSHDFQQDELEKILDFCMLNGVDGFVVSGNDNVRKVAEFTKFRVPIIGYGGIRSGRQAQDMLDAGASLIEITTGLVLEGPSLVSKILKYLENNARNSA